MKKNSQNSPKRWTGQLYTCVISLGCEYNFAYILHKTDIHLKNMSTPCFSTLILPDLARLLSFSPMAQNFLISCRFWENWAPLSSQGQCPLISWIQPQFVVCLSDWLYITISSTDTNNESDDKMTTTMTINHNNVKFKCCLYMLMNM